MDMGTGTGRVGKNERVPYMEEVWMLVAGACMDAGCWCGRGTALESGPLPCYRTDSCTSTKE